VTSDQTRDDRRVEFERLAMPHAQSLYRTALRLTGRAEDAHDLVQETFLRAYRTFASFKAGTNERAWLFTILYSIMSNRWRSDRGAPDEVAVDDLDARFAAALAASGADAEQLLLARLDATPEVQRALEALPEAYRAAVLLVDVEELTYEEASAVLACPVGTVRSRLARGRRLLFTALSDYARSQRLLPSEPS
jgi:RNA polymerase sigma-70 factor, ECF subfamily